MKISEVAKLSGVTVRTLHYYDEIGLLKPDKITKAGYRVYSENSLERLQQILFFRELEFSLKDIKEIMINPDYDKDEALRKHKELLIKKKNRLENLISLVDKSIKGENNISFKEFDMSEIENIKNRYAKEVKKRWGNTKAYEESVQKTEGLKDSEWEKIINGLNDVIKEFASIKDINPEDEKAQDLVEKWQKYITDNFYDCSKEILSCLGFMYIGDERFTKNIDKYGEGTAKFINEAIQYYCEK